MKNHILIFMLTITFFACGDSSSSDDDIVDSINSEEFLTDWNINNISFEGNTTNIRLRETGNGVPFESLAVSSKNNVALGDYNGSTLVISYTRQGAGEYPIMTFLQFAEAQFNDVNAKAVIIECSVGSFTTKKTTYSNVISAGNATITIDADNKYHFDVENIEVTQTELSNGGVSNAPRTTNLTIVDAFDFSN